MSVLVTRTAERVRLVWSEDPDVTHARVLPPARWILASTQGLTVAPGATVATVRALDGRERMGAILEARDGDAAGSLWGSLVRGVVEISGADDPVDGLRALGPVELLRLSDWVWALSEGREVEGCAIGDPSQPSTSTANESSSGSRPKATQRTAMTPALDRSRSGATTTPVSYTHLTLPTNREV